ncbi:MAG: HEAT repeat domain-containing protein [Anaerolineae bacterium]|nr:HEAT repeat domain-containing protein [Anaerolineae bacterium]
MNNMQNDTLLHDLKSQKYPDEDVTYLRQAGITTYGQLLALLGDDSAESDLRVRMCHALWRLSRTVDKRKASKPLLAVLNGDNSELRSVAAVAAGMMNLKRAIPTLSNLATDKSQPYQVRMSAIQAFGAMMDARALPMLKAIVADTTDDLGLRGSALEQTTSHIDDNSVQYYTGLLSNENADLRFWAAYCLGQLRYERDATPALHMLDQVVAFDHTLPIYWGWHVDREALLPFETIYFRILSGDPEANPRDVWVISPTAEYTSFIRKYRHWTETWVHTTDPTPPITLHIDSSWLIAQLQRHWTVINLDVRRPRPKAYLFDFQLMLDGQLLIGGLHRDGYTLILTGENDAVCVFAAWYRGLFAPDQALYLYTWAGFGIRLAHGIDSPDIIQQVEPSTMHEVSDPPPT